MRDIKTVLRGYIPSGEIKEWDVTPTVTTVDSVFTNEGIYNATFSNGSLSVDNVAVIGEVAMGVMKTALTLADLSSSDTLRYSVRLSTIIADGAVLFGLILLPSSYTAEQASTAVIEAFESTGTPPYILSGCLRASVFKQSLVRARYINDLGTTQTAVGTSTAIASFAVDTDYTEHLFLRNTNGNFYIGKEIVDSDGITYDIYGTPTLLNSPVLPDDMTLFVFAGSFIVSGGVAPTHAAFSVTPTFDIPEVSRNVTGTTFATTVGAQSVFDSFFPIIKRPSITEIIQKTFPLGTRPLEMYKTKIDSNVSVPIEPYGISVTNNQLLVINSVTLTEESFTPLLDVLSLSDTLAPVYNQQANMLLSISEIADLVQQSATDVNRALINAGEIVVYVEDPNNNNLSADMSLTSNVTYASFQLAYDYLASLPKFIKKRIVFDDRFNSTLIHGIAESTYNCGSNNITLSTISSYIGIPKLTNLLSNSGSITIELRGMFTELSLENFEGRMTASSDKILNGTGYRDALSLVNSHLIGFIDNFALPAIAPSNFIHLGDNSVLTLSGQFYNPDPDQHPNLTIVAAENSRFNIDSSTTLPPSMTDKLILNKRTSQYADAIPAILVSSGYFRRTYDNILSKPDRELDELLWLINLTNQDTAVIRHPLDIGSVDPIFTTRLVARTLRFIVAGAINLGDLMITSPSSKLTFIGMPGATITSNGTAIIVRDSITTVEIFNLKLHVIDDSPLLRAENFNGTGYPSLIVRDSTLSAVKPIEWVGASLAYFPNTLELTRVQLVYFAQPMSIFNVSSVIIKDVVVDISAIPVIALATIQFRYGANRPRPYLDIDGVTLLHRPGNTSAPNATALVNIVGYYEPSNNTQNIILRDSKRVNMFDNTFHKEVVVLRDGAIYEHYEDTNFQLEDGSQGYAFTRGHAIYNIGSSANPTPPQLTITVSQLRGFQIFSWGLKCARIVRRRYKVTISGKVTAAISSYSLTLKRKHQDEILNNTLPDTSLSLDAIAFTGVAGIATEFSFTRAVTLGFDDVLVIYATNNIDSQDVYLSGLTFNIEEM